MLQVRYTRFIDHHKNSNKIILRQTLHDIDTAFFCEETMFVNIYAGVRKIPIMSVKWHSDKLIANLTQAISP